MVAVLLCFRLDPLILDLDAQLDAASNEEDAIRLKKAIKDREDALLPLYLQVCDDYTFAHIC